MHQVTGSTPLVWYLLAAHTTVVSWYLSSSKAFSLKYIYRLSPALAVQLVGNKQNLDAVVVGMATLRCCLLLLPGRVLHWCAQSCGHALPQRTPIACCEHTGHLESQDCDNLRLQETQAYANADCRGSYLARRGPLCSVVKVGALRALLNRCLSQQNQMLCLLVTSGL